MTIALTGRAVASRPTADAVIEPRYDHVHGSMLPAWQTRMIVFTPIVGTTLLAKFGLPPLAAGGIGILYPLTFAMLAYGFLSGQLQFEPRRLAFYFTMLATLGLMQVMRTDSFSTSSFLMMTALTSTYVFTTRTTAVTTADALRFFCNLTLVVALLGVGQFAIQFAGNEMLTFPIETFVPEAFQTKGYNNITPLYYGSPLYRSTAFVMLEPSVFSQICAIGFIAELIGRSRYMRLAIYAVALIVAYSGTGLMILAVSLPILVIMHRRWELIGRGLFLLILIVALAEPLNLTVITNRVDEFQHSGSSGFMRFVGWQDLFSDRLWPSATAALFGHGAGAFEGASVGYTAAQMAFTKIVFEFGVLGALVYFSYMFFCIYSNGAPRILHIAITVCTFMNGAYSPTLTGLLLSVLLWPNSRTNTASEARHAT